MEINNMEQMMNDVPVGTNFSYNNENYVKIADERVNCCKVYNAMKIDSSEKVMIIPAEKVTVQD